MPTIYSLDADWWARFALPTLRSCSLPNLWKQPLTPTLSERAFAPSRPRKNGEREKKRTRRGGASLPLRANRHCEERQRRLVRRSSTSEGGSNRFLRRRRLDCFAEPVIGRASRDPLARNDDFGYARVTNRPDGANQLLRQKPVQPHQQKYFAFRVGQISSTSSPRPFPARGALRGRHERGMGCGGRGSVGAQMESQGRLCL